MLLHIFGAVAGTVAAHGAATPRSAEASSGSERTWASCGRWGPSRAGLATQPFPSSEEVLGPFLQTSTEVWPRLWQRRGTLQQTPAPKEAVEFNARDAAMSRMLYGFYMLASCPELMTPEQQAKSGCKHCQAAGFDFVPGELRIAAVREHFGSKDLSVVMARLRPLVSDPGGPDGCMVAIRGTQNFGNLIADMDLEQASLPGCTDCKVHHGWLQQWNLLRPAVVSGLADLGCNSPGTNTLYLTGHSSGCAVADYAMMDLHQSYGYELHSSIGYGCPKPGNEAFASAFDAMFPTKVWKVQVDFDPVRHLPPEWTGYRDLGYAVLYNHSSPGGYTLCGKGATLCGSDDPSRIAPSRLLRTLAAQILDYHCMAPHPNEWADPKYTRCDATCDATLLDPEWAFWARPATPSFGLSWISRLWKTRGSNAGGLAQ
mmetsp:Transcript_67645/g.218470  ORF Transcript_67645/g.218470 Transcript_67645/m.218470 type:complete len:429 (-) Transcript_67645:18-1304(-)